MRAPSGYKRCKGRETGQAGRRDRVGFIPPLARLGSYEFIWKIRGQLVDRDTIRLASEGV
jgi:hypothetical protein